MNSINSSLASHTIESELEENEGYQNEPEYTKEELRAMGTPLDDLNSSEISYSSSSDDQDSQLENFHWCSCTRCVITFTMNREEALCCRETSNILGEKLDGIKCITFHDKFKMLMFK